MGRSLAGLLGAAALACQAVAAPAARPGKAVGDCIWGAGALAYFNLPLETQRIVCPAGGVVVLDAYAELQRTPLVAYRHPKGELLRLPVMSARVNPADDVEIQVSAPAQLWSYGDDGVKRNETGDIVLGTKWAAFRERGPLPGAGVRWTVKLPNASDQTGLGTDQPDVGAQLLVSRTLGSRLQLDGNMGLLIMGDPTHQVDQVDVFTYGVAASGRISDRLAGVFEVAGMSGKQRFKPQCDARAGLVWEGPWPTTLLYAAVAAPLDRHSPEWGVRLGVGWAPSFSSR